MISFHSSVLCHIDDVLAVPPDLDNPVLVHNASRSLGFVNERIQDSVYLCENIIVARKYVADDSGIDYSLQPVFFQIVCVKVVMCLHIKYIIDRDNSPEVQIISVVKVAVQPDKLQLPVIICVPIAEDVVTRGIQPSGLFVEI